VQAPRFCRIYAVNGGRPLLVRLPPDKTCAHYTNNTNESVLPSRGRQPVQRAVYYYNFAIAGECGDVDACVDAFAKQMGLEEVKNCYLGMSKKELHSIINHWREHITG